jgi:DNA-binding transcriptional LysR family regulator
MSDLYQHVHKLWLFSLIAEHRSLRRASLHARLSQSSLSQHLAALEKVIGVTLVVRSHGALSLTPRGESFLAEVKPILEQLDAISSRAHPNERKSTILRLGAYESVALTYLPRSISELTARHDDLTVTLRMGRSAMLETYVREGELDMAILDLPSAAPLDSVPLTGSRLGLYRSARPPSKSSAVGEMRVGTLSYVRGTKPAYFRRFLEFAQERLSAHGSAMNVVVESDSFETLRAIGCEGSIVVVLPEHVATRARGDLTEVAMGESPPDCTGQHVLHLVSGRYVNSHLRDALVAQFAAST